MKRNLLMRKKFQNYVMHFIVLINPEIKELVVSGLGLYITKMILEQHQFPYCIENTEKGIKVEIRCYEPTRRLL